MLNKQLKKPKAEAPIQHMVTTNVTPFITPDSPTASSTADNLSFPYPSISIDATVFTLFDTVANGQVFHLKTMINAKTLSYRDNEGNTCLHIAIASGQIKSADLILKYDIDVNIKNSRGLTPLYLLIDKISNHLNNEESLFRQYQLAQLLIKAGANPNIEIKDTALNRSKITALHKAVALEQYTLMKILLSCPAIDLDLMDSENWNALNWAIESRNKKMLARLLIDRRWQEGSIQLALQHITLLQQKAVGKHESVLTEMFSLIEKRQNTKLPSLQSGIQWINKFSIIFGSHKSQKQLIINSDKEHAYLAMQNEFARKRIFDPKSLDNEEENKDFPGNPVTASITFIISAESYRSGQVVKRKKLTLPLDFIDKYHISREETDTGFTSLEKKDGIKHRAALAPSDIFEQPKASYKPLTPEEIEVKYQAEIDNKDPSFKQLFHHGEQSLLDYLEQPATIKQLILQLKQHPKFVFGCKVYGLVLNIYSPRYACENCEISILGEQNPNDSPFLTELQSQLNIMGCALPRFSALRMLTQISGHMAFHKEAVPEKDHESLHVDLRSCDNNLILARDVGAFDPKITQFCSSKLNK